MTSLKKEYYQVFKNYYSSKNSAESARKWVEKNYTIFSIKYDKDAGCWVMRYAKEVKDVR